VLVGSPHLRIRGVTAKGGRGRRVPLWWDAGTLADLVAWRGERVAHGGRDAAPFVCSVSDHPQRATHFISHALAGGRTLAEVRDAGGHSSVLVTSAYLHVAVEDDGAVGSMFRVE